MVTEWTPDSWRQRPILQQPEYPDAAALERTLDELRRLPPLVTSWEILDLREQLAEAAAEAANGGEGKVWAHAAARPWKFSTKNLD